MTLGKVWRHFVTTEVGVLPRDAAEHPAVHTVQAPKIKNYPVLSGFSGTASNPDLEGTREAEKGNGDRVDEQAQVALLLQLPWVRPGLRDPDGPAHGQRIVSDALGMFVPLTQKPSSHIFQTEKLKGASLRQWLLKESVQKCTIFAFHDVLSV